MHPTSTPILRAALAVLVSLALCLAANALATRSTPARAASMGQLQQQIGAGQGLAARLAGAVGAANGRIAQLGASIRALRARLARIQADLDAKRMELVRLRSELDAARARLKRLEAFDKRAEAVLSRQLVSSYESDTPDLVTVVLNSTGFQQLLEQLSFQQRIRKQDVTIIEEVRAARRAVAAQATRLGALEVRQQKLTEAVLTQRNALDQARVGLVTEQLAVARSRDAHEARLAGVRGHVADLRRRLARLQAIAAAQAAAAVRAAAAAAAQSSPATAASASPSGAAVGPSQVSSAGGFTFPLPKGSVAGAGSWSLDDGVDIAAAGGTPEFAVCSGTIVLHGIGGFGPWAPVLHCDSALAGYSYVYYGHAGPANQLPVGTHVAAGEVMSEVGPGIVGISTGPHIEIGFCDSSGAPIGPGSAPAMMSLLQSAN